MRLPAILMIAAILALITTGAQAQERSIPLSLDAAVELQRTPALIVHEALAPLRAGNSATVNPQKTQGAQNKNAAPKTLAAGAPTVSVTAPLIVMPAAPPSGDGAIQTTGNPRYDEFIAQSAARNGVDANLIVAVMRQESGFNSRARSYKGATGLMQLMPATAQRFGVANIWDPAQNIEGGARYLRFLLDSFNGDVKLALAGYNAGENAVVNSGFRIPRYRETQNYVRSISARYEAGKYTARAGAKSSPSAPSATVFTGGAASSRLSNNY
jgi:soluble lytic murein transglycosylase-like protein